MPCLTLSDLLVEPRPALSRFPMTGDCLMPGNDTLRSNGPSPLADTVWLAVGAAAGRNPSGREADAGVHLRVRRQVPDACDLPHVRGCGVGWRSMIL